MSAISTSMLTFGILTMPRRVGGRIAWIEFRGEFGFVDAELLDVDGRHTGRAIDFFAEGDRLAAIRIGSRACHR